MSNEEAGPEVGEIRLSIKIIHVSQDIERESKGNLQTISSQNIQLTVIHRKFVPHSSYRLVLDCGVAPASLESNDSMPCTTDLTT